MSEKTLLELILEEQGKAERRRARAESALPWIAAALVALAVVALAVLFKLEAHTTRRCVLAAQIGILEGLIADVEGATSAAGTSI